MKNAITVIVLLCAFRLCAANVLWGSAFLIEEDRIGVAEEHDKYVTMGSPYLQMGMDFSGTALVLTAMPDSNLENANSFVEANKGDVVDASYMKSHLSFAHAEYGEWGGGPTWTDYTLVFHPGDTCYLAFSEERFDSITYGWVQLGYAGDGHLSVLASAWDKDGDSIVVGAIPEPSSGVLVLLGLAGLALRRKHTIRTMRTGGSATATGVRERGVREAPRKVPSRRSS